MLYSNIKNLTNGVYPFHMPGHKRNPLWTEGLLEADITEIAGADNLHAPDGVIKDAEKRASACFGTTATLMLTGGSTVGVLASISAVCNTGDRIIIARNCHKSVFNAVRMHSLDVSFVFPQIEHLLGCYGRVEPWHIADQMDKSGAKIVVVTSPTYEGVVSDIKAIAHEVHLRDGILIVDSAHGAHLGFSDYFPPSARHLGADIVIESAHKTLPCLTGGAYLHICTDSVRKGAVQQAVGTYLTSSPPYPILCSLDRFVSFEGKDKLFNAYVKKLDDFYSKSASLGCLKIVKTCDPSKIVISCSGANINGFELKDKLLMKYGIELEMAMPGYALAMTSVADTQEGFNRLLCALKEISSGLAPTEKKRTPPPPMPKTRRSLTQRLPFACCLLPLGRAVGRVSCDSIFAYPPGSPIIAPGEEITEEVIEYLNILSASRAQILSDGEFFPEAICVFEEYD